jgi:predicted permease
MFSRILVSVASLLVPSAMRKRWREEWRAELHVRGRHAFDPRALGALADAVATRRSRGTAPVRSGLSLDTLGDDVQFGWRQMRRHPGVSTLIVLVIALGTGFASVLFSLVYTAFFKPWPIERPEDVAFVYRNFANGQMNIIGLTQRYTPFDVVKDIDGVADVGGWWGLRRNVDVDGLTESHYGEITTAGYFDALGVRPLLGRTFLPDEDAPSNPDMPVVISHEMWRSRFGENQDVLGRQILVNKRPATIIGVIGPDFRGIASTWDRSDLWMLAGQVLPRGLIGTFVRLKPGATFAQVVANLNVHGAEQNERTRQRSPQFALPPGVPYYQVIPATELRTPQDPQANIVPKRIAVALVTVVLVVLLIATINVAGLLAARGLSRTAELATRRVLGVTPVRLARQLAAEGLGLSLAGGALGVLLAGNMIGLFTAVTPARYAVDAALDWPVVASAALIAVVVGIIVSLAPIRHALTTNVIAALAGSSAMTTPKRSRLRHWVVLPQLALSLLLLVGAGVHVRSLASIERTTRGYVVEGATVLALQRDAPRPAPGSRPSQNEIAAEHQQIYRSMREVLRAAPGMTAGLMTRLPLTSTSSPTLALSETLHAAGDGRGVDIERAAMSPGALPALGLRIVAGRDFDDRDTRQVRAVAVVSERVARQLWPGRSALGERLGAVNPQATDGRVDWYEVVGVVNDTVPVLPRPGDPPRVYTALGQAWQPWSYNLVVGGRPSPEAIAALRSRLDGVDPYTAVTGVQPLSALVDRMLYPRRLAASVLTASGLIGLMLACVGLYGVISFTVTRQMRELGIRAALGARQGDLVAHVLRDGGRVAVIGSVLGVGGALVALRATAHLAEGVPTTDWLVLSLVPLLLSAIVLLACYGPARRAGRVDPVATLKS